MTRRIPLHVGEIIGTLKIIRLLEEKSASGRALFKTQCQVCGTTQVHTNSTLTSNRHRLSREGRTHSAGKFCINCPDSLKQSVMGDGPSTEVPKDRMERLHHLAAYQKW